VLQVPVNIIAEIIKIMVILFILDDILPASWLQDLGRSSSLINHHKYILNNQINEKYLLVFENVLWQLAFQLPFALLELVGMPGVSWAWIVDIYSIVI
jgi:hypothetical protein